MMMVMPHPDGGVVDGGDASTVITCGANGPALGLGDTCQLRRRVRKQSLRRERLLQQLLLRAAARRARRPVAPGTCLARAAQVAATQSLRLPDGLRPPAAGWMGPATAPAPASTTSATPAWGAPAAATRCLGAFACDGTGVCKAGVTQMLCIPYSCDTKTGTCFHVLHLRPGGPVRPAALVRPQHGELRQGRHRRALQRRRRLHLGQLRGQRLLQHRLQGRLRGLQSPRPARRLLGDRLGKARSPRRLQGSGGGQLRPQRDLRRRRRLRQLRAGHPVPRAVVHRQPAQHGGDLRRSRQVPAARRPGLPSLPLRRRRVHEVLPDGGRLRSGNRLPPRDDRHDDLRAEAAGRQLPGAPANAPATSASTASAARAPAAGPASTARCRPRPASA